MTGVGNGDSLISAEVSGKGERSPLNQSSDAMANRRQAVAGMTPASQIISEEDGEEPIKNPRETCVVAGAVEGDRPAQAEAVRESTCVTASSELPDTWHLSLRHVETDEATHSGQNLGHQVHEVQCSVINEKKKQIRCLFFCKRNRTLQDGPRRGDANSVTPPGRSQMCRFTPSLSRLRV